MNKKFLNKVAVVQMWPEIKAAEDEVIARIKNTFDKMGVEVLLIDVGGNLVSDPSVRIDSEIVDFVIHLHFETPKTYDAFSFVALWNPLQFYFDWGYRKYSNNIVSHDDFLSCSSDSADDHVKRQVFKDGVHLDPFFKLFHSLSTPILEPSLGKLKIFYIGINWERLGKKNGRHHDLLESLDQTGELVIYGPDKFQGVRVWDGFRSYAGPLPFDGVSIIKAINKAGITLVLSSEAHVESALMSSRLFEGLAAGSVIIVDENPFAKEHFGDSLLYIKTIGMSAEQITAQVRSHLSWIRGNPKEALRLAKNSQIIFKNKFDMSLSLQTLYDGFLDRKQTLESLYLHDGDVYPLLLIGVLQSCSHASIKLFKDNYLKQRYQNKSLTLIIGQENYDCNRDFLDKEFSGLSKIEFNVVKNKLKSWGSTSHGPPIGALITDVIQNLAPRTLVSVMTENEDIQSNHYSALVRAFEDDDELELAYSDILVVYEDGAEKKKYDLNSEIRPFCADYNCPNGFSRFVFKVPDGVWTNSTLRYLGFGWMDAIYSKSGNRKRIARASCHIDIQSMPYQPDEMCSLDSDVLLLEDSMSIDERRRFAMESFGDKALSCMDSEKIDFSKYSLSQRRAIIVSFLDALELPAWLRRLSVRCYRFIRGRT